MSATIPSRGKPACCAACESRTTKRHCPSELCGWVRCLKCGSVTGIVGVWADRKFIGWKRAYFGGGQRRVI